MVEAMNRNEVKTHRPAVQLTLPQVLKKDETVTRSYTDYKTAAFKVRMGERMLDNLNKALNKTVKTKTGYKPKHTEAEKRLKRMDYIQKRMRPLEANIDGTDWEGTRKAIYQKLFGQAFE